MTVTSLKIDSMASRIYTQSLPIFIKKAFLIIWFSDQQVGVFSWFDTRLSGLACYRIFHALSGLVFQHTEHGVTKVEVIHVIGVMARD